ncbi:MAG TPA: hypothetical protein VGW98_04325 [Solirubrobacteraceae bacterium]|nr:hypothetical protein [Solirubrobacteraceae bacterium]
MALLIVACTAALASGCGGSRQDANEASRGYAMEVVRARFPVRQWIARPTSFALQVRNAGGRTVPNVAVTLDSFYYTEHYPELASDKRPIWVIEQGPGPAARPPVQTQEISKPGGGQTAYVNTWALGPLAPNGTQTFIWRVVPVKAGVYTVRYTIAAGLAGRAKAQLPSGGPVQGQLTASIAPVPLSTHVDPRTGRVVYGAFPLVP